MTLSPRRAASYRLSLRLLLSPARLRESLTTLQPQPSLRNATIAGAQVALALVLIAAALHPSPWQHVLGFACLGALAALFGRCATVAQRRRIVLIAGALLLGPVAVLSWLSWLGLPALALLLALAAITGGIAALAHRLQTGVPGAMSSGFLRLPGAGPRLEKEITSMALFAPVGPMPQPSVQVGRSFSEAPTVIMFLPLPGVPMVPALEPELPAEKK